MPAAHESSRWAIFQSSRTVRPASFPKAVPVRTKFAGRLGFLEPCFFRSYDMAAFNFLEVCRMKAFRALAATVFLSLVCVSNLPGQDASEANPAVNPAFAPPYLLVLVHQEILYGKATARQK